MDDSCGGFIIGIIIIIALIGFVISVLAYVAMIVAVVAGVIGAVVGLYVAIKSFILGVQEAWDSLRVTCKDDATRVLIADAARKGDFGDFVYEDVARKSFFWGPCFGFIKAVYINSFSHIGENHPEFGQGESWWSTALYYIKNILQLISTYVIGGFLVLCLSLILTVVFMVIAVVAYIVMGTILLLHKIFFAIKHISYRCPQCKRTYSLPKYICPVCNISHINLKPGFWGIERRQCICGTLLPLTVYSVGGTKHDRILLKDLKSSCPYPDCGKENNAGLTRPVSIAFIGGQSAGKTTFQIAFLRDFVDEELVRCDIDYDFPNKELEMKFKEYENAYAGRPIAASQRGIDADITSFNMILSQKKLSVERMMSIYDMPGEVFLRGDAKEGNQLYTIENGAVFVLDPYSIATVRSENENDIAGNTMGICNVDMNDLVQALIDSMESVRTKKKGGKFILPIAVAVNKIDTPTLRKQTGEDAVEAMLKKHPDIFTDKYMAMDYVCRCFLVSKGGANFINNLDNHFNTVHYFFSSPMGYVPKGALSRFKPVNVMDIMRWMILRADEQFRKVWTGGVEVEDLTEQQKKLYLTNGDYYREYINKCDFL